MKTRVELEETSKKILNMVRTELYLSMRFMGPALGSLDFQMDLSTRTVGTDAVSIRFNPAFLMQSYLERPELLNRTYMHMLMHCLFRHMFSAREHKDGELWDLCCDIAAESVVDSMDYPTILRVTSDFRQQWYEKLEGEVKVLTAEKLYHYFSTRKRDPYMEESLRQEFALCDHSFWERMKPPEEDKGPKAPSRSDSTEETPRTGETGQQEKDAVPFGKADPKEDEWKEHAKRIQSDMETYAKDAAEDAGKLLWMLSLKNRVRKSYREFLKKFAVVREEVSVDMDSFDYGFYMYGLNLYGNMPLIEENEYREAKRIEELVIAIDTSASCKDKLVQQFLNETGAILKNQESFFHHVNVRILECDNQIQKDIRITNLEDLEKYADQFEVQGGYGTDFRPVFSYVEELRQKGELRNLRGLMYFTDGFGTYPEKPTDYETVFVFYGDEEKEEAKVPDWALKLYLDERKEP